MEIHGTADGTVAYDGTAFFEGTEDVIDYWVNFNEITSAPIVTAVPDIDPEDECTAERWLYEDGSNGVDVELYKVIDGGHTWPGASVVIGTTNQDFDATAVIWEFFSRYDINGEIQPSGLEDPEAGTKLTLWPNPCVDVLYVDGLLTKQDYVIMDALGRQVLQGNAIVGSNAISVSGLNAGLYQIRFEDEYSHSFVVKAKR
jgi:polyhydroxybutyrate depolymerase